MQRTEQQGDEATEFYREVLLSYRLIFGQDRTSFYDFNKMSQKSGLNKHETHDPMLAVLCGQSCEAHEAARIYDEIHAGETSTRYNSSTEFPFLGQRFLELQTYVQDYRPNGLSTFSSIWNDKRDVSQWRTFWVCEGSPRP